MSKNNIRENMANVSVNVPYDFSGKRALVTGAGKGEHYHLSFQ